MNWQETAAKLGCGAAVLEAGTLTSVNPQIKAWSGTPKTMQALLTTGSYIFWQTSIEQLLQLQSHAFDLSLEVRTANGPFAVLGFAHTDAGRTEILLVPYHERARFHKALRGADQQRAADELEIRRLAALESMRVAFINDVAHQLATPLTPVRFQLSNLKRLATEPGMAAAVASVEKSIDRLQLFHDAVIEVARVQAGDAGHDMRAVDLDRVVAAAGQEWTQENPDIPISVHVEPHKVVTDATELRLCIRHLLDNAARFAGDTPIELRVAPDAPTIHIMDRGPGIPEGLDVRRSPFGKGESSIGVGAGMGLHLVDGLMRALGGTLELRARAQGGTDATLQLPPID